MPGRSAPPAILLGFDFGERRIGVAVGQSVTGTARALTTLTNRQSAPDWEAIGRLLAEWRPDALVVGIPRHMDDSEHALTRRATRFRNQLAGRYNLPVHTVDERLTSVEAEQTLRDARRGRYDKSEIDRLAAELILQSWLDEHAP